MSSRGLGRGLEALLPDAAVGGSRQIRLDELEPNPEQPRREFDEAALAELAGSIGEHGVLQPILARDLGGGRWQIVAGERRWRAARRAGLETVPVVMIDAGDESALELALIENLQREDLNPMEAAAGFARLTEGGMSQAEVAERVGKSRSAVTNALRLLQLPLVGQELVAIGALSEGQARAVLGAPADMQEKLAERAVQDRLSVRELEEMVQLLQPTEPKGGQGSRSRERIAALAERSEAAGLAERAQAALQTRVSVKFKRGGGGQLVVDWHSSEQLARIIQQIASPSSGDHDEGELAL